MDLIQRVVKAGRPANPEQLRLMLEGCSIHVTESDAENLYARYAMPWITQETPAEPTSRSHSYH